MERWRGGALLHVGCGPARIADTPFAGLAWREQRLDLDPAAEPDLLASITAMDPVASNSIDAVYSSHNLEHLYAHEVPLALQEWRRVLRSTGFLLLTCPDLQSVAELVAADRLTEPAYSSAMGPIAPIDILYGHRGALAAGHTHMAHRCGFTARVLTASLRRAGFASLACQRRPADHFDLWVLATASPWPEADLRAAVAQFFPAAG